MRPSIINAALGVVLIALGVYGFLITQAIGGVIPTVIGLTLIYLAIKRGRIATLIFGHACIAMGAYLITWGILLLPYSEPTLAGIFGRPLFWGIFSLMGGVCAIFHGFCRCVTRQVDEFEGEAASRKNCC